ncbi:ATP-dependent RNA helicase RhlB [Paraphotobacterium marinum]|uniref:ATP-dependent RNA helicase RhlB n=1 Tax=Paraphotobacterium marinum TaxID=1755811 RepID=A0A220VD26_9GAMM|nr:ATP-dependent RNA helicase RhlB [Paraphotobacterium marinum]ASK78082.1 ATP-dependent RNA helicase RhlB [Paraphotobacterium marinum]
MTDKKFSELNLQLNILEALHESNFTKCTNIQSKALPLLLEGKDVIAQSQTGSGKTLTFLTATYNYLQLQNQLQQTETLSPRALILAPTRELALQVQKDAQIFDKFTKFKTTLLVGGESIEKQKLNLTHSKDIIIGTCGRVTDFIKQGLLDLSLLEVVVLDEADRMLDLGFIKDIRFIFKQMPPPSARMTMLFSATFSHNIKEMAYQYMKSYEFINVNKKVHNNMIDEELFYPSNEHKLPLLQTLIEEDWPDKAIIFANTKIKSEEIFNALNADNHRVGLLTGDIPQKKRLQTLDSFTLGHLDILVATDVAARGLHIPDVTHVYNFDLPDDCEDYVHRIGRTGRAGESGHSISFACEDFAINLTNIEQYINHNIPVTEYDPEALLTNLPKINLNKETASSRNYKKTQINKNRRNYTKRNYGKRK